MSSPSYLFEVLNTFVLLGVTQWDIYSKPELKKAVKIAKLKDYFNYRVLENIPPPKEETPHVKDLGANLERIYEESEYFYPEPMTFDMEMIFSKIRINVRNNPMEISYMPKNHSAALDVKKRIKIYEDYNPLDPEPIAVLEPCFYSFPSLTFPSGIREICFPMKIFMGGFKTKICEDSKLSKDNRKAESIRNITRPHEVLVILSGKTGYIVDPYGTLEDSHKVFQKLLMEKSLPFWVKKMEYIPLYIDEMFEGGPGNCTEITMAIFYMLNNMVYNFEIKGKYAIEKTIKFLKEEQQCDRAKRMGYFYFGLP